MEQSSILKIVQTISQVFPQEASIAIADKSQFVYYKPSKSIDLKIRPGDRLKEGSISFQAIHNRQKVAEYIDERLFGTPYYGMSTPILQDGDAECCITTIFPPFNAVEGGKLPKHNFLIGKAEDRWIPIPLTNIHFIESEKGKTLLCTDSGIYMNKYTLLELEKMLPQEQFIRCHRAYVVNVNAIAEIQPDFHSTFVLVMKDANRSRVPVSQKYASLFRRLMGF
ncbi:LytTR family DNA-binding domain-containing protein [Aneurinibacillus terranovensis]|uniref:LytTR family DNA-binding domain-containing protein n=1 Tax=Aneurinibacillus terranovensis TaxID=278991 RepID=UPI000423438B|nr:LytTR family DNA-binding domain-containing protein [Aneurinibacillus terranovensis]